MAKRKSTDKTPKDDTDQTVEGDRVADQAESSGSSSQDLETAADAVEAVDAYAPAETPSENDATGAEKTDTAEGATSDDAIEQPEPKADDAADGKGNAADTSAPADDHLTEEEAERLIGAAEAGDSHPTRPEPVSEPETPPVAPQVIRETTVERKGGFVPMLVGGAVAAVLGYGVAAYTSQAVWPFDAAQDTTFEDDIRDALTAQDGTLSELGTRIATLEGVEPPTFDLSPVEDQIASLQATTSDLSARLDDMVSRIDTLERQPLESAVSEEAIAAYERALADLQAEVEAQRAEVSQMAQEAVAAEENAEENAQLAASRAALAEITTALESGASFSGAVAVLSSNGVAVPEALSAQAESGVPTQSGLAEAFPDAARAALREARSADTEGAEGVGRITTFFANQLGARSVAPKEGDDADAVLSRAEAAVGSGDLSAALSELSALPETAQGALSDWQDGARARLEAKTAADDLVQQLLQE
ncbi:MAG: mitofilin family membrane protein [Pelagibaca sp.]